MFNRNPLLAPLLALATDRRLVEQLRVDKRVFIQFIRPIDWIYIMWIYIKGEIINGMGKAEHYGVMFGALLSVLTEN